MATATDFRSMDEADLLELAKNILRSQQADQQDIFDLAKVLKNRWKRFGRARKLLWLARSESDRVINRKSDARFNNKLRQQHALCTYKDPDLPADLRYDRALTILDANGDLATTTDQESLGLAGGLFKAKWETFGQFQDLQRSLLYYQRGWAQGPNDDGYTGINTAYLLDLIAHQEDLQASKSGLSATPMANERRQSARAIREQLVKILPSVADGIESKIATEQQPEELENARDRLYWIYVTLGEAYLGLGIDENKNFDDGKRYLAKAAELDRGDWMVESTARQLASLARLLPPLTDKKRPRELLTALLGDAAEAVETALIGKIGLALSGGGFRASLFHIGVLARLAEMDVLRHVEYLSCVSGGSIIGAYYYMEIRECLQQKPDPEITRDDYIRIVKNIEREFLAGVQKNVRMRSLTSISTNFRHDLSTGVLPTPRTAELYDELLYSRIKYQQPVPRHMEDLKVKPGVHAKGISGEDAAKIEDCRPKEENWRRKNKVPILILNCTTFNTGHNWQFTATWMGEPPATISNEIDANKRLRRMYYSEAPEQYRLFPISRAVAASASVPALFAPLELQNLYPEMTVRLADGGVHDNQGVASLLEQGCTVLLVSDASGQLPDESDPGKYATQIALRSDDISQERVRVSQYQDLESRVRSSLLRSLMFLHLKKGLDSAPLDWVDCQDPVAASDEARPAAQQGVLTPYGVHKNVQTKLAAIRTDLDSFHDAEAYALMASGYKMADFHFPQNLQEARHPVDLREPWQFRRLDSEMTKPKSPLLDILAFSNQRLFKVWELVPWLKTTRKIFTWVVIALAAAVILWLFFRPPQALWTLQSRWLAATVISLVLGWLAGKTALWLWDPKSQLLKLGFRTGASVLFALFASIHLAFFDRLYLRKGSLENVLPK